MNSPVPPSAAHQLRKLTPIDKLTQASFRDLLHQTSFSRIEAGSRVLTADRLSDASIYLLEGTVEVTAEGHHTTVAAGTEPAAFPLGATISARIDVGRAISDCVVALVPTSLLDVLINDAGIKAPEIEVSELKDDEDEIENQIMVRLFEAYANEELDVPSLPDVAFRIRGAVEDPNVTAKDIERIVTADPAVAARLIQVANSAVYLGAVRTESCRDAVTRLGFTATREVVTSVVLKEVFRNESPALMEAMQVVWQHSTRVASICYHLAKAIRGFSADRALLAGLVHDIGALPVIAAAQDFRELKERPGLLLNCINELKAQVGAMVLRHWEFPEDLIEASSYAEDWTREGPETADYCDLVSVAHVFAAMGTPEFSTYPPIANLPAFARLTTGELDVDRTLAILEEAEADINELQAILSG